MRMPTDAEIAAAKAEAAQRFGRDELLLCTFKAPIDFACLIAPFDFASYCVNADDSADDMQTSLRNCARRQRVWPEAAAMEDRLNRRPALAHKIVGALMTRAGNMPGDSRVELLADVIARAPAKEDAPVIQGLTRAKASKILEAEEGGELWAISGPGSLSCIMATPEGEVWLAAKTAKFKALLETKKRIVEASWDFISQAIRWSSTPIDALINDKPAHVVDLRTAYETIGGEDAESTSKSV